MVSWARGPLITGTQSLSAIHEPVVVLPPLLDAAKHELAILRAQPGIYPELVRGILGTRPFPNLV